MTNSAAAAGAALAKTISAAAIAAPAAFGVRVLEWCRPVVGRTMRMFPPLFGRQIIILRFLGGALAAPRIVRL